MLEFVHQKARRGKYHAEAASESYGWLGFGQTEESSRWITFLVKRWCCLPVKLPAQNACLVYVTHDTGEAEELSEHVFRLRNGCLET